MNNNSSKSQQQTFNSLKAFFISLCIYCSIKSIPQFPDDKLPAKIKKGISSNSLSILFTELAFRWMDKPTPDLVVLSIWLGASLNAIIKESGKNSLRTKNINLSQNQHIIFSSVIKCLCAMAIEQFLTRTKPNDGPKLMPLIKEFMIIFISNFSAEFLAKKLVTNNVALEKALTVFCFKFLKHVASNYLNCESQDVKNDSRSLQPKKYTRKDTPFHNLVELETLKNSQLDQSKKYNDSRVNGDSGKKEWRRIM